MKRLSWITGLALLFSTQVGSLQGAYPQSCGPCSQECNNSCNLCDIDFCDVDYTIYVDFLWWKLNKGDLYATLSDDEERYICPKSDPGWRIGAVASFHNLDLGIRYTQLYTKNSRSGIFFFGEFDELDAGFSHHFKYRVLDIELGYSCCICQPLTFRPFVGAKLAWIDDELESDAEFFDEEELLVEVGTKAEADFKGYGLYLGLSSRWELLNWQSCGCNVPIALVGRFSTGVLDSHFHRSFTFEIDGVEEISPSIGRECFFTPYADVYVGLDFTFCDLFCDTDVFLQIGYEAQYWGWREYGFFEDTGDITHLGLGGLVVRVGATF